MTLQALESKNHQQGGWLFVPRKRVYHTESWIATPFMPFCVAQMEYIVGTCKTLHAPSVGDPCGRTHRDSTDRHFRTIPIVRQKQSNAQLSSRRRISSHSRPRLICLILRSTFLTITSILETISSGRDLFLVPSR